MLASIGIRPIKQAGKIFSREGNVTGHELGGGGKKDREAQDKRII